MSYYGSKDTTDDYRSIDVRRWQRDGFLEPGRAFSWQWQRNGEEVASIQVRTEEDQVVLIYRHKSHGEDWQDRSYSVRLSWSSCNYGGSRPWFICPAQGCERRVALLYSGRTFACRHCYKLAYESQRETYDDRAARRANLIRRRLDWQQGILNPKGWKKPKGMHWNTFERLNEEHDAFVSVSLAGMAKRLRLLGGSPDDWI